MNQIIPVSAIKTVERLFVVFALLFFTYPIIGLLQQQPEGLTAADLARLDAVWKIIRWGIYAVTLLLLMPQWKTTLSVASRDKLLWGLVGLALLSVLWSDLPATTLRRSIGLVATTLFGVYLAKRYSIKEQLQLLAWMFGIAAVLSLLLVTALPIYGIHEGGWRGIYSNQNLLGRLMCLGAIVFLILARSSSQYRWIAWAGCGFTATLMWASTSKTALVVFLAILVLLSAYQAWRRYYPIPFPWLVAAIVLGGCAIWWLLDNLEIVTGLLGKDITLSKRTIIWEIVLAKIGQHPWLGYGYSAFWSNSQNTEDIMRAIGNSRFIGGQSHNGFLDLGLDFGGLGLLTFMLHFASKLQQAFRWLLSVETGESLWPLTLMSFTILYNLTESTLLTKYSIFWIVYVAAMLSIPSTAGSSAGDRESNAEDKQSTFHG